MEIASRKTIRELEFDQILEQVSQLAASEPGRRYVLALEPSADRAAVVEELEAVDEARRLLGEYPELRFRTPLDKKFLDRVRTQGAILEPELLIGLRDTYDTVDEVRAIAKRQVASYPRVLGPCSTLAYHQYLHHQLRRVFTPRGDISDDASPELAALRRHQRSLVKRIDSLLERLLRDGNKQQYLAEDFWTVLNDRYVVLVKADFKGKISGLVQGESSTGLSLYVEPMEVVEANNECIEARVEEMREIRRILRTLSEAAHEHRDEYPPLLATLAWLDAVSARARYAMAQSAILPRFSENMELKLDAARHPLLGDRCVPADLALTPEQRVVIISGVNSGGKTVALKTIGLFALMAQCGIHWPSGPDTVIPFFDRIASEIGDQQSIAQNLSSFSSHATHVGEILGHLGTRSLLLFDEFMTGTDPEEGAALAEAVLSDLARRDALAFVTTHYGPLKLLVKKYTGFVNCAVEFDWERLAPTFRLQYGLPGSSLGIDIARRFGMPEPVCAQARALMDSGKGSLNAMIADVEAELVRVRREREDLKAKLAEADRERNAQRARWDEFEAKRKRELDDVELSTLEELEAVKAKVHEALKGGTPPPQLTTEIQTKIRAKEAKLEAAKPEPPRDLSPGDWVRVPDMRDPAVVVEVKREKNQALVMINGMKVKTELRTLERVAAPAKPKRAQAAGGSSFRLETSNVSTEINLIAMRVEEAEEALASYLDAAVARSYKEVRVVHGRGTGALRSAVEKYLRRCKFVKEFRPGGYGEGEAGVTIVTLK